MLPRFCTTKSKSSKTANWKFTKIWWKTSCPKLLRMPPSEDGMVYFVSRKFGFNMKTGNSPILVTQRQPQTRKKYAATESVTADSHICIWEIASKRALKPSTVHKILYGSLHMRKLAARWDTALTDVQKASQVGIATYLFSLFESDGPKLLTIVVIWDETWIYFYVITSTCQNAVQLHWDSFTESCPEDGKSASKHRYTACLHPPQ